MNTTKAKLLYVVLVALSFSGTVKAGINDGLVAYYPLDGDVTDTSGWNNHANSYGGLTYAPGVFGQAASFDGINDYLEILDNSSFHFGPNDFSVSTWMNTQSWATGNEVETIYDKVDGQFFGTYLITSSVPKAVRSYQKPVELWSGPLEADQWHLITYTRDSGHGNLYINDELVADEAYTRDVSNAGTNILIGKSRNQHTQDRYFSGLIDDARIYNRALSAIEVSALSNGFGLAALEPPQGGTQLEDLVFTPPSSGQTGAIYIVHGHNSSPAAWADDLVTRISSALGDEASSWHIEAIDWSEEAGDSFFEPSNSANDAEQLGRNLGRKLQGTNYERIHFIGHSAGTHLINAAADELVGEDVVISSTFLDAFTPRTEASSFGASSDWAEHYYRRNDLGNTEADFVNAFNIDVSELDSDFGLGSDADFFENHSFPHVWYRNTVDSPNPSDEGWGFQSSLELGTLPNHTDFARGSRACLGSDVCEPPTPTQPVIFDLPTDIQNAPTYGSAEGQIALENGRGTLQTASPVWLTTFIELDSDKSFLSFGFEFGDGSGGEGVFAVYWGDELLARFDERFSRSEYDVYLFDLGDAGTVGGHELSFRLDSFSEAASIASFDNIRFGHAVPLPAPILMLLSGLVILIPWRLGRHDGRRLLPDNQQH